MKQWSTHELHPLCTLFPRMIGEDFDALVADIAANGLQSPIVLHDGMILDGGNRYRACQIANVEPRFVQFDGESVVAFVLSANLRRRHMSIGQQAAIVSSAQDWSRAQSASRPTKKAGNDAGLSTVADRAAQSGASDRTQRMADKVVRQSPGDLAIRVAHGEMSLPAAAKELFAPERKAKPATDAGLSDADHIDEMSQEIAILRRELDAASKDNAAMGEAFDADDKLAVLHRQNKELREVNRVLQSRLDGEINKNAELVREVTKAQRKIERMERASVQVP